jgi:LETM1 and EF-hand domain-containing protein 1
VRVCKQFEDSFTLENLNRPQIVSICRYLNIRAMGSDNFLRYLIRKRMQEIKKDDEMIVREGVPSLSDSELISACQARGLQVGSIPLEILRTELQQWIELHVKEKMPFALLLLSQALSISDSPVDRLKIAISSLPEEATGKLDALEGSDSFRNQLTIVEKQQQLIEAELQQEKVSRM